MAGQIVEKPQTTNEMIHFFKQEVGIQVDDIYIKEFKRWLLGKDLSRDRYSISRDYYFWLIEQAQEYSRLNW